MRGLLLCSRRCYSAGGAASKISPVDAAIADTFASFQKVLCFVCLFCLHKRKKIFFFFFSFVLFCVFWCSDVLFLLFFFLQSSDWRLPQLLRGGEFRQTVHNVLF